MVVPLPAELVESIIDNLDPSGDKSTLLNCALVGRAWVHASQRSIFQTIHFQVPNPEYDNYIDINDSLSYYIDCFLEDNDRLTALLDEKPILVSYVLCLELENFNMFEKVSSDDDMDDVCASMTEVVSRLTKVKKISMVGIDWDVLSSMLRKTLTNILSAPSMTSLTFESFTIATAADFASLFSHSVHLKALEAVGVKFCKKFNANIDCTGPPLKLDTLVFGSSELEFLPWFQQRSCPLGFANLRSLRIWLQPPRGYEIAAFLLQQAGHSLTELELDLRLSSNMRLRSDRNLVLDMSHLDMSLVSLPWLAADIRADMRLGLDIKLKQDMDWFRTETPLETLLGYTPSLKCIRLVGVPQKGSYTPVPWILSLLKPLLNSIPNRYPLECITFGLRVDCSVTMEWDSWSAFDVLLENPKFDSLRTVDIVMNMGGLPYARNKMGREAALAAVENLTENLPFLKRSGKLQIRVEK